MHFVQQLINGLATGSIYALIALGYTLVFGVLRFINFAHGDIMMIGAYAGYLAATLTHNLWVSILVAGALSCVLGLGIERLLYRPLRRADPIAVLVCAVGASFLLEYGVMLIFGSQPKGYPAALSGSVIRLGPLYIDSLKIIVFVLSVVICLLLALFFKKTKVGIAMRGYGSERKGALLCGVSADHMVSAAFAIGCFVAGACGVLYGAVYSVTPFMGIEPGIKAFTAAVIGGIGSIPGAFLGGLFLGLAETLAAGFISSSFKNLVAFVLLIITLLFFPAGLTNAKEGKSSLRD